MKGNRTVIVWAFLRGDGIAPPFDSVEAMSMVKGGFIIGGKGAQQIAALNNIDLGNFSNMDHVGFEERNAQVSVDHKMEAIFLLITHLMQYVVDGNKAFGRALLRRMNKLVERFRAVAQGVRTFQPQNTRVASPKPFKGKSVHFFHKVYPGVDAGSIPTGAHPEAGSWDVPGSERRIPDATPAFHANAYVSYSGIHLPGGRRLRRGAHRRGV